MGHAAAEQYRTNKRVRVPAALHVRPPLPDGTSIHVVITTYERPDDLLALLCDISSSKGSSAVTVTVYDDASPSDYSKVETYLRNRGWTYHRSPKRHGKKGYALWLSQILAQASAKSKASYVMVLQDDVRLCHRFFSETLVTWKSIPNKNKGTLQLMRDAGRAGKVCWTGIEPKERGSVTFTGWVDCLFMTTREIAHYMGATPPKIDGDRWSEDASRSSGFGEHYSKLLVERGYGLYCARKSLIAHLGQTSTMNPKARRENPALAVAFRDGDCVHKGMMDREPIVASLATIPSRQKELRKVVQSLLPQVHEVRVYLNGYKKVPSFLEHPRITVVRSQDQGDRGDAGKFYWIEQSKGYVLSCDDDIIYPQDYAVTMVRAIERHKRKAVVSVHGSLVVNQMGSYFRNRELFHFRAEQSKDRRIHVPGTGVTAFHVDALKLTRKSFSTKFMADIHLAVAAKTQGTRVVLVAHPKDWVRTFEIEDTLYARHHRNDAPQTKALNAVGPW